MKYDLAGVAQHFPFDGTLIYAEPYGEATTNACYALYYKREFRSPVRCLLQRLNLQRISDPQALMEDIENLTGHIANKLRQSGGDVLREGLTLLHTNEGERFWQDEDGGCWRLYRFIDDAICCQTPEQPEYLYQTGIALGRFHRQTADFPIGRLHAPVPDAHDPQRWFEALESAALDDVAGQTVEVTEELAFALQRKEGAMRLLELLAAGTFPLRVVHGDARIGNVLIDCHTGRALCMVDLDTVAPGITICDFGVCACDGAVRSDGQEPVLDLDLFAQMTAGYLSQVPGLLTPAEVEQLPFSVALMALERGVCALTGYLHGEDDRALARCRASFGLVEEAERRLPEMQAIVRKYQ